ncbi:MAG: pilus assembly protein CpaE [Maricaulis sp.]|jgi:pilus assembly protein CpaE|nr:pilus assembly protein CpaE [Maricaulis sp.]HAQ33830.1 pilus assembly protein CpaE [Alphaproteobacteria bacterium]
MAETYSYEDDDDFLNGNDDFVDAEEIERRILGEMDARPADDGFDRQPEAQPRPQGGGNRPFGATGQAAGSRRSAAPEAEMFDDFALDDTPDPMMAEPQRKTDTRSFNPDDYDMDVPLSPVAGDASYGEVDNTLSDQPVPRIAIHAFCERPETGALLHNAAGDRRMQKAHVEVELGGLPAAIERFYDASTPNLLIVETGMRGQGLFDQLEELAGVCDPDTKVIIIGAANDIALYRELMKRGVSEYLVPPMTPLHIIRAISGLYLDPEAPFAGKSVAFIGAKGGVGASTIAHNTAWCVSEGLDSDCVLVDLDLSFGTAGLDFNQDPAQTLGDALNEPDRLDDALLDRLLVRCTDKLSLFSAPATLDKDWDFTPESYDMVLDKVKRQAPFIALDLPHTWSPWVRQTLLSSDQVVVTVTPDLASLRNAKNLFDLIASARPNDELPKVVVNMAGVPKRPEIPVKDFAEALGTPPALVLPFEPQLFGKAANNGQMICELDPKSKAAEGFNHLASLISGRVSSPPRRSIISKMFGR